jgi:uncharacterized membrane protein
MAGTFPRPWESNARGSVTVGVLTGLMPLLSLAAFGLALLLTAGVRGATADQGFFAQQQLIIIAFLVGLAISTIVYAVLCRQALRRARQWLLDGSTRAATGAYWALGATALIVLLPLLVALFMHQAPFP